MQVLLGGFLLANFHSRLKPFSLANFFDPTNVSVQVILFLLNLVLKVSLTFFGMESKRCTPAMLILLIFTFYNTFDILLQWWLLIRLKFFSNFFSRKTHPTDKIWLVLIISYYHLVLLYEKDWDHYFLAGSQWLCKCTFKSSIQSLGPLLLFQVICWDNVWL